MLGKVSFVDIYSGGGFGAVGAASSGAVPLLAVDSWRFAADTYKRNFPETEVVCSNVESLNPSVFSLKHKPDVLLASPECTSHSIARGSRPVCERSRETTTNLLPWIDALNARWIVIENVRRAKRWHRYAEFVREIENRGYTVSELILNAADFGVAQSRKRMFLICDREGASVSSDDLVAQSGRKRKPASTIIDSTGKYRSRPLNSPRRARATIERAERAIDALGTLIPFFIVYYGSDYAGGWQPLENPLRTVTTLDRFGLVTWESTIPMLRMLQPHELVRAMGATSAFKFAPGTRRDKIKLCGNGVCSPVMEAIFRFISEKC